MNADELVIQRIKQFDVQHGDDPVRHGTWLFFADGATRQVHIDYCCPLIGPPGDALERAKLVHTYHELKLKRARDAFAELKAALRTQVRLAVENAAACTPTPPPNAAQIAELARLKEAVEKCQKTLFDARIKLEESRPAYLKEREARAAANRDSYEAAREAIEAIEI